MKLQNALWKLSDFLPPHSLCRMCMRLTKNISWDEEKEECIIQEDIMSEGGQENSSSGVSKGTEAVSWGYDPYGD